MEELSAKIGRHKENILNSIRCQANSAKSEAANTTIKVLIKMARSFRNIGNYTNPMVMRTFMFEYCDETAFLTLKVRITLPAKIRGSCSFRLHHQAIKVQHQV